LAPPPKFFVSRGLKRTKSSLSTDKQLDPRPPERAVESSPEERKQPCWHNKRTPPRNSEIEKATSARYNFEALKVAQIILDSTSTCGTKSG